MSRVALLLVLLVGVVAGGLAVEIGAFDGSAPADQACTGALPGDSWTADLNASQNVSEGTRLVCEHANGTRTAVTVNMSVDVDTAPS